MDGCLILYSILIKDMYNVKKKYMRKMLIENSPIARGRGRKTNGKTTTKISFQNFKIDFKGGCRIFILYHYFFLSMYIINITLSTYDKIKFHKTLSFTYFKQIINSFIVEVSHARA